MMAWLIPAAPWLPPITSSVADLRANRVFAARSSIDAFEFVANRRAGNFRPHFGKKRRALLESEQNGAHHARGQAVRLSGNRIRFVNESRDAAHPSGQHRRGGSEAAHAEDDMRLELPINRAAERKAFVEAPDETRKSRAKKATADRSSAVFRSENPIGRKAASAVDLLFGNEEHHFVAAGAQNFRDREPGKRCPPVPPHAITAFMIIEDPRV